MSPGFMRSLRRTAKKGGKVRTNDQRMCEQGRTFGRTPGIGQRVRFVQPAKAERLTTLGD